MATLGIVLLLFQFTWADQQINPGRRFLPAPHEQNKTGDPLQEAQLRKLLEGFQWPSSARNSEINLTDPTACGLIFLKQDLPAPLVIRSLEVERFGNPFAKQIIKNRKGKSFYLLDIGNFFEWKRNQAAKLAYFADEANKGAASRRDRFAKKTLPPIEYDGPMEAFALRMKELRHWTTETVLELYEGAEKGLSKAEKDLLLRNDFAYQADMTLSRYYVLFDADTEKDPWEYSEKEWKESLRFAVRMAFSRTIPIRTFTDPFLLLGTHHFLPHFSRYSNVRETGKFWQYQDQELYPEAREGLAALKRDEQWVELGRLGNFTRNLKDEDPNKIDSELTFRMIAKLFYEVDEFNRNLPPGFAKIKRVIATANRMTAKLFIKRMKLPFSTLGTPKLSATNEDEVVLYADTDSNEFVEFVRNIPPER